MMAGIYLRAGQNEKALEYYEKAVALVEDLARKPPSTTGFAGRQPTPPHRSDRENVLRWVDA